VYETRHQFHEDVDNLERQALGALDLVVGQLDRALEAISDHDVELARLVIADDARIDGRFLDVHQGVLSLLVRQAPVAGDLRMIVALMHTIQCIERMGDQCVNIAKLVPLSAESAPTDRALLEAIDTMGQLARHQVIEARLAFKSRHVSLARGIAGEGAGIGRLSRQMFRRAVEIGDDAEAREWAMLMLLVARALERIANNAIEIAEQTVFVVTGVLRQSPGVLPPG
jgi:phosphate transport system protein